MQDDIFSTGQQLPLELGEHFQISQLLLSSMYRQSNGFFTFEKCLGEDGHLQAYCL
jgi:hypothetical protein